VKKDYVLLTVQRRWWLW